MPVFEAYSASAEQVVLYVEAHDIAQAMRRVVARYDEYCREPSDALVQFCPAVPYELTAAKAQLARQGYAWVHPVMLLPRAVNSVMRKHAWN